MPMTGPAELFTTTRTPALDEATELKPAVTDLRSAAGTAAARSTSPYRSTIRRWPSPTATSPPCAETFARYEAAGVTWVVVNPATRSRTDSLAFLQRFGAEFLRT